MVIFIVSIAFVVVQLKKKREYHKKSKIKDFCNVAMPSEDTKILEFNQYQKFDKAPFIIYADLECLKEKVDGCKNNLKSSFITKDGKNIESGFSISTVYRK